MNLPVHFHHSPSNMSGNYSPRLSISLPSATSKDHMGNNDLSIRIDHEPRRNSSRDHNSLGTSEEEGDRGTSDESHRCSDRTKKCVLGVMFTILIACCWVATLHTLKVTFTWNQRTYVHPWNRLTHHLGASLPSPVMTPDAPKRPHTSTSPLHSWNPMRVTTSPIIPLHHEPFTAPVAPVPTVTSPLNEPSGTPFMSTSPPVFSSSSPSNRSLLETLTSTPTTASPVHSLRTTVNGTQGSASNVTTTDEDFNAPFFMAWYCSIWNIFYLPLFSIFKMFSCCFSKEKSSPRNILVESLNHLMSQGITPMQFLTRCSFFCVMWMLTNYLLIYTLRRLDVTVVMALYACTVTLVYLLSWVVLHHQFVGMRIVAVIICDTGVALLAYMDGTNSRTLACVFLAAAAAISSSIYKVFYRRMIGYGSYGEMSLFFTLIGLLCLFLLWPMVLLLYFTGSETLTWNHIPWGPLSAAAGLNLSANLLSYIGSYWTYEIFLSFGVLIAIPISSVIDATVYKVVFKNMKLGGIILIMLGFCVVLLPDNWNQYLADVMRSRLVKWKRNEQMKKSGTRVQDTTTAQLSRLRTPSGRVK